MKIEESSELTEIREFLDMVNKMGDAERAQLFADARVLSKALHTKPADRTMAEAKAVAVIMKPTERRKCTKRTGEHYERAGTRTGN
jgi:hypothetical protein